MKLLLLTAAMLLAGGLAAAELGQPAPPLDIDRVIGGKRFRIEDMAGKKMVVLHFWTRDCRPCDNAVPLIAEAARKFGGSTVFLAVGDSDERSVEEYPQLAALTIPAAVDHLSKTYHVPKVLLLDEHTAALDPGTAEKVLELTRSIVEDNHITFLMITHNMQSALDLGNRTLMMDRGKIIYDVTGEERSRLTIRDLTDKFRQISGRALDNDRMLLSD